MCLPQPNSEKRQGEAQRHLTPKCRIVIQIALTYAIITCMRLFSIRSRSCAKGVICRIHHRTMNRHLGNNQTNHQKISHRSPRRLAMGHLGIRPHSMARKAIHPRKGSRMAHLGIRLHRGNHMATHQTTNPTGLANQMALRLLASSWGFQESSLVCLAPSLPSSPGILL